MSRRRPSRPTSSRRRRRCAGAEPLELRFLHTDAGLIAFLTLGMDPHEQLADAHARASTVKARIRDTRPAIADVLVHTEPE